jgi:thiamine biosynthesis lipoprotein
MSTNDYRRFSFEAFGTLCDVQFESPSFAREQSFRKAVVDWVCAFEQRFSRFRPDSLISRINAAAGAEWVAVDEEADSLFALCDWFHWSTQGIFDPAILPLIKLWDYHNPQPVVPDDTAVRTALSQCGWSRVKREKGRIFLPEKGMGLDIGGIGKEYAVDCVLTMAGKTGLRNMLVNFGHDVRACGEAPGGGPWRIGLEDPRDPGRCWAGVAVRDRAVTTSGDYIRNFTFNGRRFGHIIDARTGYPVANGCKAVSVIAPTCTEAGILSTAAFILGGEEGVRFLSRYHHTEGCVWQHSTRHETGRLNEYLIDE